MARDTLIVIPCFNEAARIDVRAFEAFDHPAVRICFIDDGSTDETRSILAGLAERHPSRMELIAFDQNAGKAAAVRAGVLHALASAEPELIGYWDADLATPLDAILRMRELITSKPELLMVLGARVRLLGRDVRRDPVRHVLGRVFATLASLTISLPVYDTQCGAKLLRRSPEVKAAFEAPFLSRWFFDVELLCRLRLEVGSTDLLADRLYELPLASWHDVRGSRLKPIDFPRALIDLARIARVYGVS